jgi:hypothetical protein
MLQSLFYLTIALHVSGIISILEYYYDARAHVY